jgi:hypothetical protein
MSAVAALATLAEVSMEQNFGPNIEQKWRESLRARSTY